jgi:hypothetical protein
LVLIFLGLTLATATVAQSTHPASKKSFIEPANPPDANPQYFPVGVFSNDPVRPDASARWYSAFLRSMKEPSLLSAAANRDFLGYRFLYLRTFHHPIAVRVELNPDGTGKLFGTETSGAGGFRTGTVLFRQTIALSKEQVDRFDTLLRGSDFWALPTEDETPPGNDGAQWILEGVRDQKYHIVDRWSPDGGTYREACLYVLKLSQIKVDPKEIY